MIIKNGTVFTETGLFEKADITITNSIISEVKVREGNFTKGDTTELDATDCYVIPGLVDIHFHGCMGYDFCDGSREAIDAITSYELSIGVTSVCPATMTLPKETLSNICKTAASYNQETEHSSLVGINLEGPFISEAKKGAQNKEYIIPPEAPLLEQLQEESNGLIKLVAIAPEAEGSLSLIQAMRSQFTFSIAHTNADYKTASLAFQAGASHVTHLYNAMPPLSHREPGVIGAAFDAPDCHVEMICDGIHIHPSVVRSTFQMFGKDRVILISDSMMATGMEDGNYSLGGQAVSVTGPRATLMDGTLAGSVTNLFQCMRNAIEMGIAPEHAIQAATINPAKAIHMERSYGSLSKGKIANVLILNKDFSLRTVIYHGEVQ